MSGTPAWVREITGTTRRMRTRPHWRHFCWYCGIRTVKAETGGRIAPDARTLDHVQPLSRAGGNRSPNAVVCCHRCNGIKGDMTLDEFRRSLGGGHFWGEVYAPMAIEWSQTAPPDEAAFRRWWDMQRTVGKDDWMHTLATAAREARGRHPAGAVRPRIAPPVPRVVWQPACACWWCRLAAFVLRRKP